MRARKESRPKDRTSFHCTRFFLIRCWKTTSWCCAFTHIIAHINSENYNIQAVDDNNGVRMCVRACVRQRGEIETKVIDILLWKWTLTQRYLFSFTEGHIYFCIVCVCVRYGKSKSTEENTHIKFCVTHFFESTIIPTYML